MIFGRQVNKRDRGKAEARLTELERRALRLWEAVSRGKTPSALDQGDKATPRVCSGRRGSSVDQVTVTIPWREILMDTDEMKRRYCAKQEQIYKLEADRVWFLERGGSVPCCIGYRLQMLRIEAE